MLLAGAVLLAGESIRAMLASARLSCYVRRLDDGRRITDAEARDCASCLADRRLVACTRAMTCEKLRRFGLPDIKDSPVCSNRLDYSIQIEFNLYNTTPAHVKIDWY